MVIEQATKQPVEPPTEVLAVNEQHNDMSVPVVHEVKHEVSNVALQQQNQQVEVIEQKQEIIEKQFEVIQEREKVIQEKDKAIETLKGDIVKPVNDKYEKAYVMSEGER